jgi:hypothetical protein
MTTITLFLLLGCGDYGLIGSKGPCTFESYLECQRRAEVIQAEQNLEVPPRCYESEVEIWFH